MQRHREQGIRDKPPTQSTGGVKSLSIPHKPFPPLIFWRMSSLRRSYSRRRISVKVEQEGMQQGGLHPPAISPKPLRTPSSPSTCGTRLSNRSSNTLLRVLLFSRTLLSTRLVIPVLLLGKTQLSIRLAIPVRKPPMAMIPGGHILTRQILHRSHNPLHPCLIVTTFSICEQCSIFEAICAGTYQLCQ